MGYPELGHRYEALRPLGSGGMGEVFLVRDRITGRQCALKHLTSRPGLRPEDMEREFRALAKLRHPTVVSVYECGVAPDGRPFLTMEYVPGIPVDEALQHANWRRIVQAGAEIAHGLEVLHAAGILHGDLKPSNVLAVTGSNSSEAELSLRLVDFGLSAYLGEEGMTHRGSPGYAAPEIVRGGKMEPSSDLYALGATLFTLTSGRSPFHGSTVEAMLRQQLSGGLDVGALESSGAPAGLIELILRLMAQEPSRRPEGAAAVRRELESLLPHRPNLLHRMRAEVVVGRAPELELIEDQLRKDARAPKVILLLGQTGIGKSSLLSEAGRRAALAGHHVVWFTASRLSELLGSAAGENALALLRSHLSELASTNRNHAPVVLLDDVTSLGIQTQQAIRQFLLEPGSPPCTWIMTYTESSNSDAQSLFQYASSVTGCRLKPISRAAIGEMVGARLREAPPAELEAFLWKRGEGHPGVTLQALQTLAVHGALQETDAGLFLDREILSTLGDSADVSAALLERTSAPALELLGTLALVGEISQNDVETLRPDADQLLGELFELGLAVQSGSGFIRPITTHVGEKALRHVSSATLQTLLRIPSLSLPDRFRLLMQIGRVEEALALIQGISPESVDSAFAAAIAESLAGSHAQEAGNWHELAARRLFTDGRYEAAATHLRQSIKLEPNSNRAERLYLLSTARLRIGDFAGTDAALDELLAMELPPSIRSKALTNQCASLRDRGRPAEAESAGRRAVEVAEAANDDESLGNATQTLAIHLMTKGEIAAGIAMCERALAAHRRAGSVLGEIRTRGLRAALAQAEGKTEEALETYSSALEQARGGNVRLAIEELSMNQSAVLGDLGRWQEVRQLNSEAARLAMADHRPRNAATAYINLAMSDAIMGNLPAARREAKIAIRLAKKVPAFIGVGWLAGALSSRALPRRVPFGVSSGQTRAADRPRTRHLPGASLVSIRVWSRSRSPRPDRACHRRLDRGGADPAVLAGSPAGAAAGTRWSFETQAGRREPNPRVGASDVQRWRPSAIVRGRLRHGISGSSIARRRKTSRGLGDGRGNARDF